MNLRHFGRGGRAFLSIKFLIKVIQKVVYFVDLC